jgi:hypothetical protein
MIPNHARFLTAVQDKNKVSVRYYSRADDGVVDRICAPLEYGPGAENQDGLNRYWLWDYARPPGSRRLGLVPKQIVELQVLGEVFDPAPFAAEPAPRMACPPDALPPAAAPTGVPAGPLL